MPQHDIESMVQSYLTAAIWASTGDNDNPLDETYSIESFDNESVEQAEKDCEKFIEALAAIDHPEYGNLLKAALEEGGWEKMGVDLWLTRNHHGAGFWDGDYGPVGDAITHVVAQHFREMNVMAQDESTITIERG